MLNIKRPLILLFILFSSFTAHSVSLSASHSTAPSNSDLCKELLEKGLEPIEMYLADPEAYTADLLARRKKHRKADPSRPHHFSVNEFAPVMERMLSELEIWKNEVTNKNLRYAIDLFAAKIKSKLASGLVYYDVYYLSHQFSRLMDLRTNSVSERDTFFSIFSKDKFNAKLVHSFISKLEISYIEDSYFNDYLEEIPIPTFKNISLMEFILANSSSPYGGPAVLATTSVGFDGSKDGSPSELFSHDMEHFSSSAIVRISELYPNEDPNKIIALIRKVSRTFFDKLNTDTLSKKMKLAIIIFAFELVHERYLPFEPKALLSYLEQQRTKMAKYTSDLKANPNAIIKVEHFDIVLNEKFGAPSDPYDNIMSLRCFTRIQKDNYYEEEYTDQLRSEPESFWFEVEKWIYDFFKQVQDQN